MREVKKNILETRAALLADFSGLGYKALDKLSEREQYIADSNFRYHNKWANGNKGYEQLYCYCPYMRGNKELYIEIDLRLDHESGNIFVVSAVEKAVGLGWRLDTAKVYTVLDCGKELKKAISTAQKIYDQTFSQFKKTKAGRKAQHAKYQTGPLPLGQQTDYAPHVFEEEEEDIAEKLIKGVQNMESQAEKQRQKTREHQAAIKKTKDLGYTI